MHLAEIKNKFRKLFTTFEALSDLGPALTAERDFAQTADELLRLLMDAIGARESALFRFCDKPAVLTSVASRGFLSFPSPAVIPLLPSHVHALTTARGPQLLAAESRRTLLSSNGNFPPDLIQLAAPLRVGQKLVGMLAFGQPDESHYGEEEVHGLAMFAHYVALAVQNSGLTESLSNRVAENLKLMASVHSFYDNALEAFAVAIDAKHINIRGHSIRVGRYAAFIGEAMGMGASEASALRASGYLHDIGKVAVDRRLFGKPSALNEAEFKEMADHTIVGSEIVSGVQFPWPQVGEVVRSHHERLDGSGYPDHLRGDELAKHVRIMGLADAFDAMTSERPYRQPLSIGEALTEVVKMSPTHFDPETVQALLVQVRRDAVASCSPKLSAAWIKSQPDKPKFLDDRVMCAIAPPDVDQLAAVLHHKTTRNRVYSN
ncbi:metal dependent phosphohydrolase [Candidatus Koribacter versatilis Ellin345]|uniref:Metal dependent phosphohydrolase n=1 Tax=Koribacter versatilis (strain Ellin345) TaxID=204669 RepID=Q1IMN3_KORVE|nr:metal dependent phosphohydrolase [Candidatus Koribacter versatilis Ellin345]